MPNLRNRAAVNEILQETMAVSGHCNQIAPILLRGLQNPEGGIAQREMCLHLDALRLRKSSATFSKVGAIRFHLLRFRQLKPVVISCCPTIRHMQQKQFRICAPSPVRDGRKHRPIGRTIVERNENFLEHR